jgi:hypothetical protein
MRCNHCHSLMFEAEIVKEGHTEQTLFECPTCCRTHLYSRRLSAHDSAEYQNRKQGGYKLKTAGIPG